MEPDEVAPDVTTKLRSKVFAELCDERGLKTAASVAEHLGVSERTLDRVIDGDDASGRVIAKVMARWPRLSFRSLFAVIDVTTGEERR